MLVGRGQIGLYLFWQVSIDVGADGWGQLTVGAHSGRFPMPQGTDLTLRVIVDHSVRHMV